MYLSKQEYMLIKVLKVKVRVKVKVKVNFLFFHINELLYFFSEFINSLEQTISGP